MRPSCLRGGGHTVGDYSFFHGLSLLTNYIYWRIEPVLIGTRQKILMT